MCIEPIYYPKHGKNTDYFYEETYEEFGINKKDVQNLEKHHVFNFV